ncbi:MAG TPA: ABC transporter permease, partial [Polyangiaceae bacterium]|nr:ABC transporter permease [Polyangiaceae bacterium]
MRNVLRGMSRQLRLLFTSRLGLGLLGLLVLMSVLSGGIYQRLVLRELPVAVVDLDGSRLSRLVTTSLDATPELALSSAAGASLDDVRGRLERGEISAWVLIPEGFSANLKRGQQTQLLLATDMSNILVGKTVRSA